MTTSDGTRYFALTLDGFNCGLIQKFEGGDIEGEAAALPLTQGSRGREPAGKEKYSDVTVQMGLSMAQPVQDWIAASLSMNYMRKSGELKAADFKRETRQVREFREALLTEITFPVCDGAARDPAIMTLKFSPWIVRNKQGDGSVLDISADMAQKTWHPSDFRLSIDGLDRACSKVSKVGAIEIKLKEPGKIDYPNIRLTLPEEDSHDFAKWHQDLLADSPKNRKTGSLVFLDRNRQKALLTLTFSGLGIVETSAAARANNEDKIASVTVECYCENLTARFA